MRTVMVALWVGLALVGPVAAEEPDPSEIAGDVLKLLLAKDCEAVAELMHYPESYTDAERMEDVKGVADGIAVLLEEFGEIEEYSLHADPLVDYHLTIAGGTVPYWQSRSPLQTREVVFRVKYKNVERGVFKVVFFEGESGPEIQMLVFGIDARSPDARTKIDGIGRRFMQAMMG